MSTPVAYTLPQACAAVGISEKAIRSEIAKGNLRVHRFGRKILISPADLQEWFDSLPATGGSGSSR